MQAPRRPPASSEAFSTIRERADEARAGGRLDDAIELYGRAVRLRPSWAEGHWYLGTAYYELEKYAECRDAFGAVIGLQPRNGAAWAFKGLCEFRLKHYRAALGSLERADRLRIGDPEITSVARYHRAILLARFEQYEAALQTYADFARQGNDAPAVIEGMGIAVLRLPFLPDELPADKREIVQLSGRATFLAAANMREAAEKALTELLERYPAAPNLHYLYGVYLLSDRPDQALDQFNEELRISPNHAGAMQQLAGEMMKRGQLDAALRWATQAVAIAPRNFAARRTLGQVKLELNDVAGAIVELERAVKLEPDSPSVHYALARGYQRAGRTAEAKRERAEFSRLERLQQSQRGGPNAVGGPPK